MDAYLKQTKTCSITTNLKVLRAFYLVALRVACANMAEKLVLPCALDMCEAVLDEKYDAKN